MSIHWTNSFAKTFILLLTEKKNILKDIKTGSFSYTDSFAVFIVHVL